jgi:hypothetical protein
MSVLIFCIVVLIVVGIVCAIAYSVPFPAPLAWLRWVIPCVALLLALLLILPKLGVL